MLYTYMYDPHYVDTRKSLTWPIKCLARGKQAVVDDVLCLHLLHLGTRVER